MKVNLWVIGGVFFMFIALVNFLAVGWTGLFSPALWGFLFGLAPVSIGIRRK
ncbi:MAG: hypothetical protein ABSB56_05140 [Nitrososphaerales archaeon]|jgi:tellurite resistance protein TehA-like permease